MKFTTHGSAQPSSRLPPSPPSPSSAALSKPRKRALPLHDTPRSKRHLNAALAAHMQTLRISPPPPSGTRKSDPLSPGSSASPLASSPPSVFGAQLPPSPFLPSGAASPPPAPPGAPFASLGTASPGAPAGAPQNFTFGLDFATSLPSAGSNGASVAPGSKPAPGGVHGHGTDPRAPVRVGDIETEDVTDDNPIVTEYDGEPAVTPPEQRLIVYRPPTRSAAPSMAALNARLPPGHCTFRAPRTGDWFVSAPSPTRHKRKLAMVPWRAPSKRQLCEFAPRLPTVIPMPWRDGFAGDSSTAPDASSVPSASSGAHAAPTARADPFADGKAFAFSWPQNGADAAKASDHMFASDGERPLKSGRTQPAFDMEVDNSAGSV